MENASCWVIHSNPFHCALGIRYTGIPIPKFAILELERSEAEGFILETSSWNELIWNLEHNTVFIVHNMYQMLYN